MDSTSELDLKSNEEIIEELTKNLESSCIRADENSVFGKDSSKSNARNDSLPKETCERVETHLQDSQELPPDPPRDFVDEELLKDREIGLSESEKETLRHEAEMLKNNGNDLFKSGEYIEAISMYTQGIQTCPLAYSKERSILYANRAAAKLKCLEKESAILDCTKAIELNPGYVKALVRRGQLYVEVEKLDEALEDFKKVYSLDPSHTEAYHEVCRLPRLIEERNEKLKTEMLGKLKDLGNMVLNPFGLSTNNFELQKDPNSGGYSVKFHQNPS